MKKLITLVCILSMIFCFAACGTDGDVRGSVSGGAAESQSAIPSTIPTEDQSEVPSAVPTGDQTAVPSAVPTEDQTAVPSAAPTDGQSKVSIGKTQGNVYESEFLGIGCKLSDGWEFYSDEQIKEMNNLTADMLESDIQQAIKNANIIYDTAATESVTGSSLSVNLEKLNALSSVIYDEKAYAEASISQVESAMTGIGYTVDRAEITKVSFAGEEHYAIEIDCSYGDIVKLYEVVVCKKVGNYMAAITVASVGDNVCDDILGYFYALD